MAVMSPMIVLSNVNRTFWLAGVASRESESTALGAAFLAGRKSESGRMSKVSAGALEPSASSHRLPADADHAA